MCSFMIKIATDVIRAMLLVAILLTLGFNNGKVEDVIVEPDPTRFSQTFRTIVFLFQIL